MVVKSGRGNWPCLDEAIISDISGKGNCRSRQGLACEDQSRCPASRDDGYGRARKKLRLDADKLHKLDDQVGLHSNMLAGKELFDDGRLAIVQGVG